MLTSRTIVSLRNFGSNHNLSLNRKTIRSFNKITGRNYSKRSDQKIITITNKNGVASLVIPLSSELCSFCLHFNETVGDLVKDIRREDEKLNTVIFYSKSGKRMDHNVNIQDMVKENFSLLINEQKYHVDVSEKIILADNVITEKELNEIVEKSFYRKVKEALKSMDKHHITLNDYNTLCTEYGIEPEAASTLLESFHHLGIALHFDTPELKNVIFLKPELLIESLKELLNLRIISNENLKYISRYDEVLKEHTKLTALKEEYNSRASTRANTLLWTIFGYLTVQFGVMCRFVWWEFNWDIVEPISYFVLLGTMMLGYLFFMLTGTEFTYDGLRDHLKNRRLRALYLKKKFDWKKWSELDNELKSLKLLLDLNGSENHVRKQ